MPTKGGLCRVRAKSEPSKKLAIKRKVRYTVTMKANKVALIAQAIGMYVMHIPMYIYFAMETIFHASVTGVLARILPRALLILGAAVALITFVNILLSVVSVFKGETSPSKTVMTVKLALIPWYILNFLMCFTISALFFNPFVILALPIVVAYTVGITYFFMISTSLPDVAYYLHKTQIKKQIVPASHVIPVILLFFFGVDVIGSIAFHVQNKESATAPSAATAPSLPIAEKGVDKIK